MAQYGHLPIYKTSFGGKPKITTETENTFRVQTADSLNSRTRFRIGSVTKSFTALLTLIPAEEGYFDLNDRLSGWFPDFWPKGMNRNIDLVLVLV